MQETYSKGSLAGLLVGDALGSYYRFAKSPSTSDVDMLPGPQDFRREGIYTNSSALGLCTIATLNEYNNIEFQDMLERFYDCMVGGYMNYDSEDYYLSPISSQAIKNYSNGLPWDMCGIKTDKVNEDNDVYLRLLPVALFKAEENTETFVNAIRDVAIITHNTSTVIVCSTLYACIVRNLILQKQEKVIEVLTQYYEEHDEKLLLELNAIKERKDDPKTLIEKTLWESWSIFVSNQNDFRTAMKRSMRSTCPNVVGGIVGSWVSLQTGLDDMPLSWLRSLKWSGEAMEAVEKFVQRLA